LWRQRWTPGRAHHVPEYTLDEDGSFRFEKTVPLGPPPISIMIRSLEKDDWSPEQKQLLPDGIRDFHKTNTTLDFRHDEPITDSTLAGTVGTSYFFSKHYGYDSHDILDCLITPYDIPEFFVFQTSTGVYRSESPLLERVRLISLEQLPNTPWNASLKYFSADPEERELAISNLRAMGLRDAIAEI